MVGVTKNCRTKGGYLHRHGGTVAEAKADFESSVQKILQMYKEEGEKLPDELAGVELEYKYDLASVRFWPSL
jgi:predicted RNase H-like HicB family nuclease